MFLPLPLPLPALGLGSWRERPSSCPAPRPLPTSSLLILPPDLLACGPAPLFLPLFPLINCFYFPQFSHPLLFPPDFSYFSTPLDASVSPLCSRGKLHEIPTSATFCLSVELWAQSVSPTLSLSPSVSSPPSQFLPPSTPLFSHLKKDFCLPEKFA